MTKNKISIGIAGAGTMGSGIVQVAAASGHNVFVFDERKEAFEKSKEGIQNSLKKFLDKEKITKTEAGAILSKIIYAEQINVLAGCNFIIEAIVEDLPAKENLFRKLERLISAETVLATNTSSLSITTISEALEVKERFIGTHFFNPPAIMPLVEIVPSKITSQQTLDLARKLMSSWGKKTVLCLDTPGFIVNRVARPYYLEALRILEEGVAGVESIDEAMKKVGGFKMGPFELMDLIGNDINYKVTETIFNQTNKDSRYKPSDIQREMVERNFLGRKTGKGFYDYSDSPHGNRMPVDDKTMQKIFIRIISAIINEAADMIFSKSASVDDIDLAMIKGANYPKGPLLWADELGADKIIDELKLLNSQNKDRYRISPLLIKMSEQRKIFYSGNRNRKMFSAKS